MDKTWGAHGGQLAPGGEEVGGERVGERQVGHFFDVGSGGKRFGRTGDDDRPNVRVIVQFGCSAGDLVHHLAVERVQCLGTVQRDNANSLIALDQDGFVRHALPL